MKIKILLLLTCVGAMLKMQAQVFPNSDAIWGIRKSHMEGVPLKLVEEYYCYGLLGDTIIADKVYNKLYLLSDTTLNIGPKDAYVGAFRQEEKKVWFRSSFPFPPYFPQYNEPPYPEEILLYDFSKNVNDTIWHSQNTSTMKDSIFASVITSIEKDEQDRKIYHIQTYENHRGILFPGRMDSWIEGIGSKSGEFWWFLTRLISCTDCPEFHLTCFKHGNEINYINKAFCNSCLSCITTSGLDKYDVPSVKVVYENHRVRIEAEASVFPCELKLFSLTGQLIVEKNVHSSQENVLVNQAQSISLYQIVKNKEILKTGKINIK